MNNAANTPNVLNLEVGETVTLDLRGRGCWTGTVLKAGPRGADLEGKRGAVVHLVRNARNPEAIGCIIGSMPRLHWVDGITR